MKLVGPARQASKAALAPHHHCGLTPVLVLLRESLVDRATERHVLASGVEAEACICQIARFNGRTSKRQVLARLLAGKTVATTFARWRAEA